MPSIRRKRRLELSSLAASEVEMNAMADVKVMKTAAETALAQEFAQARARLAGGPAIAEKRAAAFDVFAREGLPHRRVEDWK